MWTQGQTLHISNKPNHINQVPTVILEHALYKNCAYILKKKEKRKRFQVFTCR